VFPWPIGGAGARVAPPLASSLFMIKQKSNHDLCLKVPF
jgi:hypothetical protein